MSLSTPRPPSSPAVVSNLLASGSKISGHRQVLIKLNWMLEDETRGAADLVEILRMDPGLSSRVIAASNTGAFSGSAPVHTVDEAVVRVGVWEIRKMLLSSIMREMTLGALRAYGLGPGGLWTRSLLTAIGMDVLAAEAGRSSDMCYTVGLLHCAGFIVIDRWMVERFPVRLPRIGSIDDTDLPQREHAATGATSDEVGAALLGSWNFSEQIVAAVQHQRWPLEAEGHTAMASLLNLAIWHARAIEADMTKRPRPAPPDASVFAAVGLDGSEAHVTAIQERFASHKSSVGAG